MSHQEDIGGTSIPVDRGRVGATERIPWLRPPSRLHRDLGRLGGELGEDLANDGVGADAFGFAFEVHDDPMAKGGGGDGGDVFVGDVIPAVEEGADFGGADEGL